MKKMIVLAILAAFVAAPAMATTTQVYSPWSVKNTTDELNLFEIVNALYGTSFTSSSSMSYAMLKSDEVFSGSQSVLAEAKYADNSQTFGWYQFTGSGKPSVYTSLFTVTGNGIGELGSAEIDPIGDYGFYDTSKAPSSNNSSTWYSEANENRNREDHLVVYDLARLTNNTDYSGYMLMGWEDSAFNCSDRDYQDLVLQLSPIVPEPMSMLLLGIGVSAFALRRKVFA